MSGEFEGASKPESNLFANLTNEEVFENAKKSNSITELTKLRTLMIYRAYYGEFDLLADKIAIFITKKIGNLHLEKEIAIKRIMLDAQTEAVTINKMEFHIDDEVDPQMEIDSLARVALFKSNPSS